MIQAALLPRWKYPMHPHTPFSGGSCTNVRQGYSAQPEYKLQTPHFTLREWIDSSFVWISPVRGWPANKYTKNRRECCKYMSWVAKAEWQIIGGNFPNEGQPYIHSDSSRILRHVAVNSLGQVSINIVLQIAYYLLAHHAPIVRFCAHPAFKTWLLSPIVLNAIIP